MPTELVHVLLCTGVCLCPLKYYRLCRLLAALMPTELIHVRALARFCVLRRRRKKLRKQPNTPLYLTVFVGFLRLSCPLNSSMSSYALACFCVRLNLIVFVSFLRLSCPLNSSMSFNALACVCVYLNLTVFVGFLRLSCPLNSSISISYRLRRSPVLYL